ncbi:MAG: UbiA prenyltransferase family protein [Bacteroidota bacterium]|nr:MAG: UbiA prenyltransferase family protein [Bacteroidota bacterium]
MAKFIINPYLFDCSTVKHLRFPFSFFLMPVFLFALSQANSVNWLSTAIAFFILHLLVFPSSNGYNSYQDRDESSIGGLKHPPKVSENLFYVTLMFDIAAVLLALLVSIFFSLFVLIFISMSRAYSYRRIRLKKYPIVGFLTVFIFQGAFVYLMAFTAISGFSVEVLSLNHIICMSVSSLFIGSVYPLTQIYQHEADKKDGVISISYKLGYKGTFIFSAILFSIATLILFYYFSLTSKPGQWVVFIIMMLPVIIKLNIWFNKVRKDTRYANFENTMTMNLLTSACMNSYFLILILNKSFTWF